MSMWLWGGVLVASIWIVHWGAEHLAEPLKKLRRQWGFTQVAGAAFIGLAAAGAEISISIVSAVRGVGDIGMGASLGANILAIPLIVTIAYWASRRERLGSDSPPESEPGESPSDHARNRRQRLLRIQRSGVTVPIPVLGDVEFEPARPAPQRALLAGVRFGRATKVSALLDAQPARRLAVGGPPLTFA